MGDDKRAGLTGAGDFSGVVELPGGVTLEMVKVAAGSFVMGSPETELGRCADEKQHPVTLTHDFWLGKCAVTQRQWAALMGDNPSYFREGDEHPVEEVSWDDARKFCAKLNELYQGRLPAGYAFDLPTAAQWEDACRAGTTTAFNDGSDLTSLDGDTSNLDGLGWHHGNSGRATHLVGRKRPNAWGLYGMHGNVWEWCRDFYEDGYARDPEFLAGNQGTWPVRRGGSWGVGARFCRSAYRNRDIAWKHDSCFGFRLALVATGPSV